MSVRRRQLVAEALLGKALQEREQIVREPEEWVGEEANDIEKISAWSPR